jgi:DNA-binding beta-propeller fold protein YncE/cytochrome c553
MRKHASVLPTFALVLGAVGLAFAGGCGAAPSTGTGVADGDPAPAPTCAAGASALRPVASPGQSSAVALGSMSEGPLAGKTLAFVADADDRSLAVVDVDARKQLDVVRLEGAPGHVMVLDDGRILITLREKNRLAVFNAASDGSLKKGCDVETAAEPIAMAVTPDKKSLLVSAGWGRALQAYDSASLSKKAEIALPREPRSVVVDDEGKTAYVSHAVGGKVSRVDLATMKADSPIAVLIDPNVAAEDTARSFTLASAVTGAVGNGGEKPVPGRFGTRMGCQGFPMVKSVVPKGRILAPQILVDPGDPENRAQGYGDSNQPTEVANVSVIDTGPRAIVPASTRVIPDSFFGGDPRAPHQAECLLPRAAAVDDGSSTLLVTCLGIDAVVAYDSASANPVAVEKARWDVGSGPLGVAVDPTKHRAIVWSQFERSLDILDLEQMGATDAKPAKHDRIALRSMAQPMPLAEVLGRQIFHAVGDTRVSQDGRACASCHPDGRDDAITWATPEGPRRTIMLAGRLAGTEPMAWGGTSKDVREHLGHTFERLNGQGLRNVELEALVAYVEALPPPPVVAVADQALVKKGEAIFRDAKTDCATCHAAGGTDRKVHDLGAKARADRKGTFDTPSLSYLSGRGPFFHDGRFETLRQVLVESDGMMGHTKHLGAEDLDALEAYLNSL